MLQGSHSGDNQAAAVLNIIGDCDISTNSMECFILDNATNNDTCLKRL